MWCCVRCDTSNSSESQVCEVCDAPRVLAVESHTSEVCEGKPLLSRNAFARPDGLMAAHSVSSVRKSSWRRRISLGVCALVAVIVTMWSLRSITDITEPSRSASMTAPSSPHFGPAAIWHPPPRIWQTMQNMCRKSSAELVTHCMTDIMQKAGASVETVAFARFLGDGYMTNYRQAGTLGVATAFYPLRANDNDSVYIVNGSLPLIDPNQLSARVDVTKDPLYSVLITRYPRMTIWGHAEFQKVEANGSRQRLIFKVRLLNGCHACERAGYASIGIEFDALGRLLGTVLLGLSAATPDSLSPGAEKQVIQSTSTPLSDATFAEFYLKIHEAIDQRSEASLRELMADKFEWALDGYTTRDQALQNIQQIIGWQQFWSSAQAAVTKSPEICQSPYCNNRAGYHVWAKSPFPLELLFEQGADQRWRWTAVLGD